MKIKVYILMIVSALVLGISSCENFLDEEKLIGSTSDSYYTAYGLDGLVGSCYSFARGWYGKEASLGLSEMGTDLFYYGYDNKQKTLLQYNLSPMSLEDNSLDNPCPNHYWELFYCAVDVCNNALKYVSDSAQIKNKILDKKKQNQYLGEAYFLRSFYYFHMVNIWGPIPYNSEPVTSISTNPVKLSEEEIYSKILADLDSSIIKFTASGYTKKTEGRANLWAARALKSRVLLYAASWLGRNSITSNEDYAGQDLYALAQAEAQAIIDSKLFSLYTKYSDTWSMINEDITKNNESIFGIAYQNILTTNVNCIPYRYKVDKDAKPKEYNSLITRTGYSRGGSAMLLMFVGMWNNGANDLGGNGKETFVRVLDNSTSYLTHYSKKPTVSVYVASTYSPYGRGFTRYLPTVYLWKLLDKYRATEQRTNETLLEAYTIAPGLEGSSKLYPNIQDTAIYYCPLDGSSPEGIAKQAWAKGRYRIQFMSNGDIPVYTSSDPAVAKPTEAAKKKSDVYADNRYDTYKIGGWCSFPGIKKFLDNVYDAAYPTNDISYRDAMVLRFAEMYLIKAECQLYTGSGADAMATINVLRQVRAITGKDNTLPGDATLETVLEERAIELCGEQQRWFDLKRTKTLTDHIAKYNAQSKNVKSFHYLRPIPQAQMDAVTNRDTVGGIGFSQNPGY